MNLIYIQIDYYTELPMPSTELCREICRTALPCLSEWPLPVAFRKEVGRLWWEGP